MHSCFQTFTLPLTLVSGTISYIQKSDSPRANLSVDKVPKSLGSSFIVEYSLVTRFPEWRDLATTYRWALEPSDLYKMNISGPFPGNKLIRSWGCPCINFHLMLASARSKMRVILPLRPLYGFMTSYLCAGSTPSKLITASQDVTASGSRQCRLSLSQTGSSRLQTSRHCTSNYWYVRPLHGISQMTEPLNQDTYVSILLAIPVITIRM